MLDLHVVSEKRDISGHDLKEKLVMGLTLYIGVLIYITQISVLYFCFATSSDEL